MCFVLFELDFVLVSEKSISSVLILGSGYVHRQAFFLPSI